jgi:hypothetical protein
METTYIGNNNREKFNAVGRRFVDCTRALAKEVGRPEDEVAPIAADLLLRHYGDFTSDARGPYKLGITSANQ